MRQSPVSLKKSNRRECHVQCFLAQEGRTDFRRAIVVRLLAGCGSPEERAQGYYERGMALIEKKDDLNARVELLNTVKYKSDKIEAWRALADIEERTKATRSLFQDLRRIVELDPKDLDARIKLGKIMFANGAADAALKLIDAGGEAAKQRADFHTLRAAILMRTNDAAGGVREAEAAVAIEPSNIDAKLLLATEKLSRGDADGAMQLFGNTPADLKEDPRISLLRIQVLGKKGDLPQAEALLKKLVADQPQDTALRSQLVQLYVAQRRFDDAEKELRAIAAAKPADSKAELGCRAFPDGYQRGQRRKRRAFGQGQSRRRCVRLSNGPCRPRIRARQCRREHEVAAGSDQCGKFP